MSSTLEFCDACSRYATGVTVITVLDHNGAPNGMTANSFTSVSLHPPLVSVCIDHAAAILAQFSVGVHLGVNILDESQQHLSAHFARPGLNDFYGVEWIPGKTGIPLLPSTLGSLECVVIQMIEAGDHTLVIAEVREAVSRAGKPLLYFNRGYRSIAEQI